MSCKDDGMCKTAAICFLDGCQAEKYTAAATTASASEPKAVQIFTCKGKGGEYELIGYSSGAGPKRGESIVVYRRTSEPDVLYHRSAHDFRERMEWLGGRAPSRAADGQPGEDTTVIDYGTPADGQQGASRAALSGEEMFNIAAPYFAWNADSWHKATQATITMQGLLNYTRAVTDAALARAPLPAQADGQAVDDARDAWPPIETAPADCLLLLAYEFDRPGDWRIKVGGYWNGEWEVFGASWTPTRWSALPPVPNVSDYEARRAAQSRDQSDTAGENHG